MSRKTKSTKKTSKKAAPKLVREPKPCCCGCGLKTGGDFRPGHDMKLRGQIKRGETLKPESKAFLATRKSDPHYAVPKAAKPAKPAKPAKAPKVPKVTEPANADVPASPQAPTEAL